LAEIKDLGVNSQSGKPKVTVDLGIMTGVRTTSKSGNKMVCFNGQYVIDGKIHYLTGQLTEKA